MAMDGGDILRPYSAFVFLLSANDSVHTVQYMQSLTAKEILPPSSSWGVISSSSGPIRILGSGEIQLVSIQYTQ